MRSNHKLSQLTVTLTSVFGVNTVMYATNPMLLAESNEPEDTVQEYVQPAVDVHPAVEVNTVLAADSHCAPCEIKPFPIYLNLLLAAADLVAGLHPSHRYEPTIDYPKDLVLSKKPGQTYNPLNEEAKPSLPGLISLSSLSTPLTPFLAVPSLPSTFPGSLPLLPSALPSGISVQLSITPSLPPLVSSQALATSAVEPLLSLLTLPLSLLTSGISNPSQPSVGPSKLPLVSLLSSLQPLFSSSAAPFALSLAPLGSSAQWSSLYQALFSSLSNSLPLFSLSSVPLALPLSSFSGAPLASSSLPLWYSLSAPFILPSSSLLLGPLSLTPLSSSIGLPLLSSSLPALSSSSIPSSLPGFSLGSSLQSLLILSVEAAANSLGSSLFPSTSLTPSGDPLKSISSVPLYSLFSSLYSLFYPFIVSVSAPLVLSLSAPIGSALSSLSSLSTIPLWGPFYLSSLISGLSSASLSLPSALSGLPFILSGLSSQSIALTPSVIPPSISSLSLSLHSLASILSGILGPSLISGLGPELLNELSASLLSSSFSSSIPLSTIVPSLLGASSIPETSLEIASILSSPPSFSFLQPSSAEAMNSTILASNFSLSSQLNTSFILSFSSLFPLGVSLAILGIVPSLTSLSSTPFVLPSLHSLAAGASLLSSFTTAVLSSGLTFSSLYPTIYTALFTDSLSTSFLLSFWVPIFAQQSWIALFSGWGLGVFTSGWFASSLLGSGLPSSLFPSTYSLNSWLGIHSSLVGAPLSSSSPVSTLSSPTLSLAGPSLLSSAVAELALAASSFPIVLSQFLFVAPAGLALDFILAPIPIGGGVLGGLLWVGQIATSSFLLFGSLGVSGSASPWVLSLQQSSILPLTISLTSTTLRSLSWNISSTASATASFLSTIPNALSFSSAPSTASSLPSLYPIYSTTLLSAILSYGLASLSLLPLSLSSLTESILLPLSSLNSLIGPLLSLLAPSLASAQLSSSLAYLSFLPSLAGTSLASSLASLSVLPSITASTALTSLLLGLLPFSGSFVAPSLLGLSSLLNSSVALSASAYLSTIGINLIVIASSWAGTGAISLSTAILLSTLSSTVLASSTSISESTLWTLLLPSSSLNSQLALSNSISSSQFWLLSLGSLINSYFTILFSLATLSGLVASLVNTSLIGITSLVGLLSGSLTLSSLISSVPPLDSLSASLSTLSSSSTLLLLSSSAVSSITGLLLSVPSTIAMLSSTLPLAISSSILGSSSIGNSLLSFFIPSTSFVLPTLVTQLLTSLGWSLTSSLSLSSLLSGYSLPSSLFSLASLSGATALSSAVLSSSFLSSLIGLPLASSLSWSAVTFSIPLSISALVGGWYSLISSGLLSTLSGYWLFSGGLPVGVAVSALPAVSIYVLGAYLSVLFPLFTYASINAASILTFVQFLGGGSIYFSLPSLIPLTSLSALLPILPFINSSSILSIPISFSHSVLNVLLSLSSPSLISTPSSSFIPFFASWFSLSPLSVLYSFIPLAIVADLYASAFITSFLSSLFNPLTYIWSSFTNLPSGVVVPQVLSSYSAWINSYLIAFSAPSLLSGLSSTISSFSLTFAGLSSLLSSLPTSIFPPLSSSLSSSGALNLSLSTLSSLASISEFTSVLSFLPSISGLAASSISSLITVPITSLLLSTPIWVSLNSLSSFVLFNVANFLSLIASLLLPASSIYFPSISALSAASAVSRISSTISSINSVISSPIPLSAFISGPPSSLSFQLYIVLGWALGTLVVGYPIQFAGISFGYSSALAGLSLMIFLFTGGQLSAGLLASLLVSPSLALLSSDGSLLLSAGAPTFLSASAFTSSINSLTSWATSLLSLSNPLLSSSSAVPASLLGPSALATSLSSTLLSSVQSSLIPSSSLPPLSSDSSILPLSSSLTSSILSSGLSTDSGIYSLASLTLAPLFIASITSLASTVSMNLLSLNVLGESISLISAPLLSSIGSSLLISAPILSSLYPLDVLSNISSLPINSSIGFSSSGLPSYLLGLSLDSIGSLSSLPLLSNPSLAPLLNPSSNPSSAPFSNPSSAPFSNPSLAPLSNPALSWLANPLSAPLSNPLSSLSTNPLSTNPISNPSTASISNPISNPSLNPSSNPSSAPFFNPISAPFSNPSLMPLSNPLSAPFSNPSLAPISNPSSGAPSIWSLPSFSPSLAPLSNPSVNPSSAPFSNPSLAPFSNPSLMPLSNPSSAPFSNPSLAPLSSFVRSPLLSSNPSLNPVSAPLVNPLSSWLSNPSSVPLSNPLLSLFSNPLIAPFSNPLSFSNNPLSWPSSGPLSSLSNPVSLSSGPLAPVSSIPSIVSNPLAWSTASAVLPSLPSASVVAPAMISKFSGSGNKKASRPSYVVKGYDFTQKKGDFEFRNLVTFGDSLSDTGSAGRGGIYMADGNPMSFYNSYMSIYLTGKMNAPRSQHGTNYAVSGALVKWASNILQLLGDPLAPMRSKMSQQINQYYLDNKGKANAKDVFVLWGGGNDMTGDMMQAVMPWNWAKLLSGDRGYFDDKPRVLGGYAGKLVQHGAKNIFVLGLPDPGLAPFSGAAIVGASIGSIGMFMGGTPLEFLDPGSWILGAMDSYLRDNSNLVGSPVHDADEYMIDNYARMYHHFVPFVPTALWRLAIIIPGQLQRNLVNAWNHDLMNTVKDLRGNIIYADIYRLYQEVQNDPFAYGFTNTLVAQCTLGKESTNCDKGDAYYHGDDGQVYMYTDWHHPSPQMNQIIAEYLLSLFNAPGYVASLSQNEELNNNARRNFIGNEFKSLRLDARELGEFTVFADILTGVDKNTRSLNSRNVVAPGIGLGLAYRAGEGLDLGGAITLFTGDRHPSNQLKYRHQSQGITLFGQYKDPNGGLWGNAELHSSAEQMDDIKRSMQFLKKVRTERGETTGNTSGGSITLGYDIPMSSGLQEICEQWFVSPYIRYGYDRYKVKGYTEKDNTSTSMVFKDQDKKNKLVTIGTQFSTQTQNADTNLDVSYTREAHPQEFIASGRLKNFAKGFSRSAKGISKERKGWLSITPSVEYKLPSKVVIYGNINYNYGSSKATQLNSALGIKKNFK